MALTHIVIEVGNPADSAKRVRVTFLVDSGAFYSVVPKALLKKLGIKPIATEDYLLADGTHIKRQKGGALFKYGNRIGIADVIFGEKGDSNLLGATALEAMGLMLDPLRRELRPAPMILSPQFEPPLASTQTRASRRSATQKRMKP